MKGGVIPVHVISNINLNPVDFLLLSLFHEFPYLSTVHPTQVIYVRQDVDHEMTGPSFARWQGIGIDNAGMTHFPLRMLYTYPHPQSRDHAQCLSNYFFCTVYTFQNTKISKMLNWKYKIFWWHQSFCHFWIKNWQNVHNFSRLAARTIKTLITPFIFNVDELFL